MHASEVTGLNVLVLILTMKPQVYELMVNYATCILQYMAGGDLRDALDKDKRTELVWYCKGYQIALDIARGLHFLHSHDVRRRDACLRYRGSTQVAVVGGIYALVVQLGLGLGLGAGQKLELQAELGMAWFVRDPDCTLARLQAH